MDKFVCCSAGSVARSGEALQALMQLHPPRLGRHAMKSARSLRRVSFSDEQPRPGATDGRAWLAQLRLEPVQAQALGAVQAEQRKLACQLDATSAHLRAWSHRREKRAVQPVASFGASAGQQAARTAQQDAAAGDSESDAEPVTGAAEQLVDSDSFSLEATPVPVVRQPTAKCYFQRSILAPVLRSVHRCAGHQSQGWRRWRCAGGPLAGELGCSQ